jgi:hypothetical protein
MSTMTSVWQTGTYDMLISKDPEGGPGDLMVVVFAAATDIDDKDADDDAPILAHLDVTRAEYDFDLSDHHFGMHTIGDRGLLQPESIEKLFGPRLGVQILLALYNAADHDFNGVDNEDRPWRTPSEGAFPLMARLHPLLMDLRQRIFGP